MCLPPLYHTDLRITNYRRQKFPPSQALLLFKTRIKWPGSRLTATTISDMIFTHQERGKGFWKFNNSPLSDPAYVRLVKDCIHETADEYNIQSLSLFPLMASYCLKLLSFKFGAKLPLMDHGRQKSKVRLKNFLQKEI